MSGKTEYEAVVFPAPLHPDMIYNFGMFSFDQRYLFPGKLNYFTKEFRGWTGTRRFRAVGSAHVVGMEFIPFKNDVTQNLRAVGSGHIMFVIVFS